MTDQKHANRIPAFNSYEEEAEFWDTHDTSDFEDEVKPVRPDSPGNSRKASR